MSKNDYTQPSLFDPIQIPLPNGLIALIDPVDSDLAEFKWSTHGREQPYVYRNARVAPKTYVQIALHRLILSRVLGRELSPSEEVDHINLKKWDNRRENLRLATRRQNARNTGLRADNTGL